jgi:arginyl-tRNA synthetase
MTMAHDSIRVAVQEVLRELGADGAEIRLERPRDPSHGDVATSVALTLAGRLGRPPRQIAEEIVQRLDRTRAGVDRAEVAGPGFINFHLASRDLAAGLREIIARGGDYGRSEEGAGRAHMVEFVSANPTGPLHLGHGRQAALGDALASLLEWTGWVVHREFYYNDAGVQIERLARSVWARYRQLLGRDEAVPEDGYHGAYVRDVAERLTDIAGDRYAAADSAEALDAIRRFAVQTLREEQDRDLGEFRVDFDCHYLESSLYTDGRVTETLAALEKTGLAYERDGAIWFRSSEFGDQKDRVMVKSDGQPTYFLPDVAYHLTKWERGFHHVINVQGSDHHGTVARVRAGLQALGLPEGYPEYVLHQMVTVERDGREVKFSKRAGSYTTLRELFEEVGVDVVRYFFQMRKPDAHLVFDLDMALDQSEKNPVYKIQYAHARMCSIFAKAGLDAEAFDPSVVDFALLEHPLERELVKQLSEFPRIVARAAEVRGPHVVCDYLEKTAGAVNSWYHAGNPTRNPELAVLIEDPGLRTARLALARAVQIVLRNGLSLLGISSPRRLERELAESPS